MKPQRTTAELLERATDHHRAGRPKEAEAFYRKVLARKPQHESALFRLSGLLFEAGRFEEASLFLERLVAIAPDSKYLTNLGEAYRRQGELEAAKASAQTTSPKKKEELADLSDQVTKTSADLAQVNTAALELMHEKARLQRIGALLKAPYEEALPTGYRVKAATSGLEAHLIAFIQDPKKKTDKTTWFDFDRLVFITESADIDFPSSRSQLENVVEILKAYPAVKLKIGAYTDAGPPARNKKLSTDRAQMVRTALIQMGVTPTRLDEEGFGAEHPVCPANDSEFCRAQNRRTAVHVTAK